MPFEMVVIDDFLQEQVIEWSDETVAKQLSRVSKWGELTVALREGKEKDLTDYIWKTVKQRTKRRPQMGVTHWKVPLYLGMDLDRTIQIFSQLAPQLVEKKELLKSYHVALKKFYEIAPNHFSVPQDLLFQKFRTLRISHQGDMSYGLSLLFAAYQFLEVEDLFFDRLKECVLSENNSEQVRLFAEEMHALLDKTYNPDFKFPHFSKRKEIASVCTTLNFCGSFSKDESENFLKLTTCLQDILSINKEEPKFLLLMCKQDPIHVMGLFYKNGQITFFDPRYNFRLPSFSLDDKAKLGLIGNYLAGYSDKDDRIVLGLKVLANKRLKKAFEKRQAAFLKQYVYNASEQKEDLLLAATYLGMKDIFYHLITVCDSVDCQDQRGNTPLIAAAVTGQLELAKTLMAKNAKVDLADNLGNTPLHYATQFGHLELVKRLLANGANPQKADTNGVYPIGKAVLFANVEIMSQLIDYGALIDSDLYALTPLWLAAEKGYLEVLLALLEKGAQINRQSLEGVTPLFIASQNGNFEIVKCLLSHGADVHLKTNKGEKALTVAAKKGYLGIVKALIAHGADINYKDNEGAPLIHAAGLDHEEIVRYLLSLGADVNIALHKNGLTPLRAATEWGHLQIVKELLDHGADINCTDCGGMTPLCFAANEGKLEIVNVLLSQGADVNRATEIGRTPLLAASQQGHLEIVKALLESGSEVNCKEDTQGYTPLMLASLNGFSEIAKTLLTHGADLYETAKYGQTALMAAALNGNVEIVNLLIKNGADVNQGDIFGFGPLFAASRSGNLEAVEALLSQGADLLAESKEEKITPLWVAAYCGNHKILEFLIEMGANVAASDRDDCTPLWIASKKGYIDVVNVLLSKGAPVDSVGMEKTTPLWIAACNGHSGVVDVLLENGAKSNWIGPQQITPLWIAARGGHLKVIQSLIAKGANPAHRAHALIPLEIADLQGHEETVNFFKNLGAK